MTESPSEPNGPRRWGWALLAVALAAAAMHGVFTLSSVFFIRDLSVFYWPEHLWLADALRSGRSPLWDPYVAFGQPAIGDAARQILFPPTLLLRLVPGVVGYNLAIALSVPTAALGAYFFLRRHASRPGAALGAAVFALSGPLLSSANFPNLSWSSACVPWELWAVARLAERRSVGRLSALAALVALQAIAGEPVTLAGAAALLVAYAAFAAPVASESLRGRAGLVGLTLCAGVAGALLATPQLLPLAASARVSFRTSAAFAAATRMPGLHPLTLLEAVAPSLFVDPLAPLGAVEPWQEPLNGGLSPFLYSIYVGLGALTLALFGALSAGRRTAVFWTSVFAVGLLCALGPSTPFYGALQAAVPFVASFRFPAKFAIFSALALAPLAAAGWDALRDGRRPRALAALGLPGAVALAASAAALLVFAAPDAALRLFGGLASFAGVAAPDAGAAYLLDSAGREAPRLLLVAVLALGALWLGSSARPEARLGRGALFALVALDLLATNLALNPTIDATLLGEPGWVAATRSHPDDRTYVGGRLSFLIENRDADDPDPVSAPPGTSRFAAQSAQRALLGSYLPSAWKFREPISVDMNLVWPAEYWRAMLRFAAADRAGRSRFLGRTGVRYYLQPAPPSPEAAVRGRIVGIEPMRLYELRPAVPRASVVLAADVVADANEQVDLLFDPAFDPRSRATIQRDAPAPAGTPGPPTFPDAEIVSDASSAVTVRARAPEGGGYLVLLDSYDPNWSATVDGAEADILRADGLFRAVRIAAGEHTVRFEYRCRPFLVGLYIAGATAGTLLALALLERRRTAASSQ